MIVGRCEIFLDNGWSLWMVDGCSGWLWVVVKFFLVVAGDCGWFDGCSGCSWVNVKIFWVVVGRFRWFDCSGRWFWAISVFSWWQWVVIEDLIVVVSDCGLIRDSSNG